MGNEVGGGAEINARNLLVKKSADGEMSKTCVLRRRREGEALTRVGTMRFFSTNGGKRCLLSSFIWKGK